jgi:hypothetical protein
MRHDGLEPCAVLETSPGHLQAWVHISRQPLEQALATAIARRLAHTYGGDPASANWRHLGRLAGFTNQKPQRRTRSGAPWVKLLHACAGLASQAEHWLESTASISLPPSLPATGKTDDSVPADAVAPITPAQAIQIYQHLMQRWHIPERFPQPDWSILDLWVARELFSQGASPVHVRTVLQLGSPGFPRRHGDPQDYLSRTLLRAFSRSVPPPPVCAAPTCTELPHRL